MQLPAIGRATGTLESVEKALDTLSDVAARRGDCGRAYGHRIVLSRSAVGRLGRHSGLVTQSRRRTVFPGLGYRPLGPASRASWRRSVAAWGRSSATVGRLSSTA